MSWVKRLSLLIAPLVALAASACAILLTLPQLSDYPLPEQTKMMPQTPQDSMTFPSWTTTYSPPPDDEETIIFSSETDPIKDAPEIKAIVDAYQSAWAKSDNIVSCASSNTVIEWMILDGYLASLETVKTGESVVAVLAMYETTGPTMVEEMIRQAAARPCD